MSEWYENPKFSEDEKESIALELARLRTKYEKRLSTTVVMRKADLKHLDALIDALADVGKELMFKQPKFSARIGLSVLTCKKILLEYL